MHQQLYGAEDTGQCLTYALIGAALSEAIIGKPYDVQVGFLYVQTDLHGTFQPLVSDDPRTGFDYHAWFTSVRGEVVDLSSRHYRRHVEHYGNQWNAPDPPEFIWSWCDKLPASVYFEPDTQMTRKIPRDHIKNDGGIVEWMTARALQHYQANQTTL